MTDQFFLDYYILLTDHTFKFVCEHIGFVFPHLHLQ